MQEAVLAFIRGFVAAGVASATLFITNSDLAAIAPKALAIGVAIAFLSGAINFIGAFLRAKNPETNFAKAATPRRASKLDWLPF